MSPSSGRRCPTSGGSTTARPTSCTSRRPSGRWPTPASPRTTSTASTRAASGRWRRSRWPSTWACARTTSTPPRWAARSWEVMVGHAVAALQSGMAETIVLVYGSTTRADLKAGRRRANLSFGSRGPTQFAAPWGHTLISQYAMSTMRHMHEFGTTIEQLAEVAVSTRLQRRAQPRRLLPGPADHRGGQRLGDDRRPADQAALLHPLRRRRRGRADHRRAGGATAPRRRCGCWARARPSATRP